MTEKEKKAAFVRDYLSPCLAAAKNDPYRTWRAEYMSGEEAAARYHPREIDAKAYAELVVCTVTLDDGNEVHYYANVGCDSLSAIILDTMKVVAGK